MEGLELLEAADQQAGLLPSVLSMLLCFCWGGGGLFITRLLVPSSDYVLRKDQTLDMATCAYMHVTACIKYRSSYAHTATNPQTSRTAKAH